jgi:trk system potassium uptake protein TrkH
MRPHVIFRYIGLVLLFNGAFMLISAIISGVNSDSAFFPLLYSFTIAILFGAFPMIFVPSRTDIRLKEGLVIVVGSWILCCLSGTLPYILWGGEFTLTNAWFESVSGFTTTGSTILSDVEALPLGLLFWRSATHWIGGIGILVFVLSILPSTGKAGFVLIRAEMPSATRDSFAQRTRTILNILLYVYVGLSVLEIIALMICGMNLFDAVTHAFATIATGGFSPKNLSIGHYRSISVDIVVIVFMTLSGIHFGLLFDASLGRMGPIGKSSVVRYYLFMLIVGTILTTINIHGNLYENWTEALRYALFQIVSLGTSTGFATADTSFWPSFAQLIMIFFTLQCACAGSTSGGIKVDRIIIFWKGFLKQMQQIRHPRAVILPKIDGVGIGDDTLGASVVYICLYLATVFFSSLLLTLLGVDSLSAFSGSAATMGNVGPGFGLVSSLSNYGQIPDVGKWVLTGNMLLGRLEIFGLIIFVMIKSWQ